MAYLSSGDAELDHIRDTFHKILFTGEKLRAVTFGTFIGYSPTNDFHEQFPAADIQIGLTDWRLLVYNYNSKRFNSLPLETSQVEVKKKWTGKCQIIYRSYVVADESLDLFPFDIYEIDKVFYERFLNVQKNNPKIPELIETSETTIVTNGDWNDHYCDTCGEFNYDPIKNSGSPYKDICGGCLRKLR